MTKISIYNIDEKVLGNDKWIGSDAQNHYATKNFTPTKLAAYFNENQIIDIGTPIRYRYDILEIGDSRLPGTITFNPQVGTPYSFSDISTFLLSKYTLKGNDVTEYLNFLIGTKVLFSKSSDINKFGYFNVINIEEYLPEPNFFQVTLEYLTGNGSIEEDRDYLISLIDVYTGGTPTLDEVLKSGNSSVESILLYNAPAEWGDYTITNNINELTSYIELISPTETYYSADYAGYGIVLRNEFDSLTNTISISDNALNMYWSQGLQYGSVNLSSGGPAIGYGKISFYKNDAFGSIRINNITENVVLEFPNKTVGTYIIATTDDITGGTLQEVTDAGNTTSNDLIVINGTNKSIVTPTQIYSQDNLIDKYVGISTDYGLSIQEGVFSATLSNFNNITHNINFFLPVSKPSTAYTLATTEDIPSLIGFVPYTGATQDVNLGEFGLLTGNIEFDITPTNTPINEGSMFWNNSDGTTDLILKGGNVTLQIGQETVIRVVNKTATNISLLESNYQVVRLTGAQGQRPKVDLALAINDANSAETLGLVTETIPNNQEGFITTSGIVRGINTTGSLQGETWADGDVLYVSGTVAGQLTNIKPIAPIHLVIVGYVIYAHINNGKIFVKVNNGYELDELHNVSAVAPANNEALAYDTSMGLWIPKEVINLLPEATSVTDGYLSSTDFNTFNEKAIQNTELTVRRRQYTYYNEFFSSISNGTYAAATVATGTAVSATAAFNPNHYGIVGFQSSTTVNSGFYSALNPSAAVHFGITVDSESQSDLVFKTPVTIAGTSVIRFGLGAGSITSVEYTSGAYFEILGNTLVGKTARASVRSSTASYALSADTWYHLRVHCVGTDIYYYVYDMDGLLLFSATLTTNIPLITTVMNQSVIATNSGTAVTILGYFDLISLTVYGAVRGALD